MYVPVGLLWLWLSWLLKTTHIHTPAQRRLMSTKGSEDPRLLRCVIRRVSLRASSVIGLGPLVGGDRYRAWRVGARANNKSSQDIL